MRREELGGTHLAGADDPDIGELIWSGVYRLASVAYSVSPLAFRPVGEMSSEREDKEAADFFTVGGTIGSGVVGAT